MLIPEFSKKTRLNVPGFETCVDKQKHFFNESLKIIKFLCQ